MRTCEHCGVEVEDDLARCPLCRARLDDEVEELEDGEEPAQETVSHARVWLWEVLSLLSFAAALITFAADFAFGFDVTWSRFPLITIVFLWVSATIVIALAEHRVWAVISETAAMGAFLFGLERLTGPSGWFLPLALPVTILAAAVGTAVALTIRKMKLSALPATAVAVLGGGFLVVGLEMVIARFRGDSVLVSWSLVAFACALALFFLILWVNKRMRERHSEYRKVFHL